MSADVPARPCRRCGTPKRIDTWCSATQECRERAERLIREDLDRIFGGRLMALPEVSERTAVADRWLDRYNLYVRRNGPPPREYIDRYFADMQRFIEAVIDGR